MLADVDIIKLAMAGMINPFTDHKVSTANTSQMTLRCPSKGLSTCGYDVVLQPKFKRLNRDLEGFNEIDVLKSDFRDLYEEILINPDKGYVLEPHMFILGVTKEYFKMPDNIVGSLFCKSTLARLGLILPPTIIEPGWSGELVVELYNSTNFPIRIYPEIGIGQVVFWELSNIPNITYKGGKYDQQRGVQIPK